MNEQEALDKMVPPGKVRPGKPRGGVIQIMVTRACDKACVNCTQGSNLAGKPAMMTVSQFESACISLRGYFGVVGVFGGNPAMNPHFEELCKILRKHVPYEQRGLWCNHPRGKGKAMRETFNPAVSNLNVHMDSEAYNEFRRDWPESRPFGLTQDSRHSPCFVAMKDVLVKECDDCQGQRGYYLTADGDRYLSEIEGSTWTGCPDCKATGTVYDEEKAWELISGCDINQHWSALIGVFRGELRAWFCEIAGAQSMLHADDPEYPDTGIDPTQGYAVYGGYYPWWQLKIDMFADQVRKHCHECGVPLRGYGSLALDPEAVEQVSETHDGIYRPKTKGRRVELVLREEQLGQRLLKTTDYMGNAK